MRRLRQESGFGLVELLIAMTVLNIAILATVAAFSSGMFALNRANKTATAAVLADVEMERLRAIRYCDIRLAATADSAGPPYTTDVAHPSVSGLVAVPEDGGCDPLPTEPPLREPATPAATTRTGADGRTYRVDAYLVYYVLDDVAARQLKRVTIVVRDPSDSLRLLTRQTSTFEEATG